MRREIATGMVLLLSIGAVWAQQNPAREQEQLRRLRGQAQQLQQQLGVTQQEKQALERTMADSKAVVEALEAEANLARNQARRQARELQSIRAERDALLKERDALAADLVDARTAAQTSGVELSTSRTAMTEREREIEALTLRAGRQEEWLKSCIDHNVQLHGLGMELLGRYEKRDFLESLAEHEPFTQVMRVKFENLIDAYRDRLDAGEFSPSVSPVAADVGIRR